MCHTLPQGPCLFTTGLSLTGFVSLKNHSALLGTLLDVGVGKTNWVDAGGCRRGMGKGKCKEGSVKREV